MMRFSSTLNWTLLGVNILLSVSLLVLLMLSCGWLGLNGAARRLPSDVEGMFGMDVYLEKGPFVFLTGKDFPHEKSFAVLQRNGPLSFLSTEALGGADRAGTRDATMGVGEHFSVSIQYSPAETNGYQFDLLHLSRREGDRGESFFDYRADGSFDARIVRDFLRRVSQPYVFYKGDWCEVEEHITEHHQRLAGGEEVVFDISSGQWRPRRDNESPP